MTSTIPLALARAQKEQSRLSSERAQWPVHSEEFYWEMLIDHRCSYTSVYEEEGKPGPLITNSTINLSQTPREQCEINCLITDESMLALDGPGQSVIIHGLVKEPGMNGFTGRVLPVSGRGAPPTPPEFPRIAVALECLLTIQCLPENVKYFSKAANPPAALGALVSSYRCMPALAAAMQAQPSPLPPHTYRELAVIATTVRWLFMQDDLLLLVRRFALVQLMPESEVCCSLCGNSKDDDFMAAARTKPCSTQAKVQLLCVSCMTKEAQAAQISPTVTTVTGVKDFLSSRCMGAFDAYTIMHGLHKARHAGENSAALARTVAARSSTAAGPSTTLQTDSQSGFFRLEKLVRVAVKAGGPMLMIYRRNLRKLLAEPVIKCSTCGDDTCGINREDNQDGYVARARTVPLSPTDSPSDVKLWCVGCITREALLAEVALKPKKVLKFLKGVCMTADEACLIMKGP